jgi:26S proteasome regulatory subunit N8
MPATTAETLSLVTRNVSVAPLVLLSVVDHYNRTEAYKSKTKRVVGVLLGQNDGKNVRVSNSFAGEHLPPQRAPSMAFADRILQFPSRRTTRIPQSGSWTTTTLNQ